MEGGRASILFRNDKTGDALVFTNPREIVTAWRAEDLRPALARLDAARANGSWLAGALAYEAGFAFEPKLAPLIPRDRETPLLQFGVFAPPDDHRHPLARPPAGFRHGRPTEAADQRRNDGPIFDARAGWDLEAYRLRFDILHRHLRAGDCYQANLTMPIDARFHGTAADVFWSLIDRQPVAYGSLVELAGPAIVSRSPELFFSVDGRGTIETHPMKGTARRGASETEDAAIRAALLDDEKTQAENRMIVDLLRNDLSRIIMVDSLSVPKLFHIETYPTVHQLVSHVRGRLRPGTGLSTILEALFPCGSITGAPKLSAMQILHRLETGPRDIYCGAIGWCDPAGPMRFSVAIRTLTLFAEAGGAGGRARFHVGGGIVFDSQAEAEYDECLLKARFAVGDQWISR